MGRPVAPGLANQAPPNSIGDGEALPMGPESARRTSMFRDRADAARQLAKRLCGRELRQPLILAIPRGGVAVGSELAETLGADLDVVLSRKLRAPHQPELAVGAVSETGQVFLNDEVVRATRASSSYLLNEQSFQMAEIERRKKLFRQVRPRLDPQGRSVIVTDDGIATGSTILVALQSLAVQKPFEVIVAVPVASPDRLEPLRAWCDEIVCLESPDDFRSVGQFYEDFTQLEDRDVQSILARFSPRHPGASSTPRSS